MATATISSSGGRVVRYCSQSPGLMAVWMILFSLRPARRMISYEMPATTGSSTMREAIRSPRLGQPRKAKTKIETSMTIKRKFVPQRG